MMKLLFLLALLSTQAMANLNIPVGEYHCPLTIEEHIILELEEDEDFPMFRGRLNPPIVRNEIMKIQFTNEEMPKANLLNPEILPSWLFVRPEHYNKATSFSWFNEDSILYQIDYRGTWYFGSKVQIETAQVRKAGNSIKVHITFDDNDGYWHTLKWVHCDLILSNI